jgi:putative redox protein
MLLASLGSCKAVTMQMYAARKGWALESVKIDLEHSREHRDDCATCDGKENRIDVIDCVISIRGDLDDGQRTRLVEIAGKCPVHRTLTGHLDINAMVVD